MISEEKTISGHSIFLVFLIGSGLSIGYAWVGAKLASRTELSQEAAIVPVAVIVSSLVLWSVAYYYGTQQSKEVRPNQGMHPTAAKGAAAGDAPSR